MYKVVISPSANADLFNALEYIAGKLKNPPAAAGLADGIEKCYADLEKFPAAHELCRDPVLARMGCRRYPVGKYLVIFRIDETAQEVRILHIFHALQDYPTIVKADIWP